MYLGQSITVCPLWQDLWLQWVPTGPKTVGGMEPNQGQTCGASASTSKGGCTPNTIGSCTESYSGLRTSVICCRTLGLGQTWLWMLLGELQVLLLTTSLQQILESGWKWFVLSEDTKQGEEGSNTMGVIELGPNSLCAPLSLWATAGLAWCCQGTTGVCKGIFLFPLKLFLLFLCISLFFQSSWHLRKPLWILHEHSVLPFSAHVRTGLPLCPNDGLVLSN